MSTTADVNAILLALVRGEPIDRHDKKLALHYLEGGTDETAPRPDRTDEVWFRMHCPAVIGTLTVLQVSHFRAGSTSECAHALAVTTTGDGKFATHWIGYEDSGDGRWFLWQGNYQIPTRERAEADVFLRSGIKEKC